MKENTSEIARLRRQLELECAAMHLGLSGFATVAAHAIIDTRYQALASCQEELARHLGEHEATTLVIDTYTRIVG